MSAIDHEDLGLLPADRDVAWPPAEFILELRAPLMIGEERISVLSLREPTCEEWEEIQSQPPKLRARFALSKIAGIPMKAVAKVGIGDVVIGENYLSSFFDAGQAIRGW